jgi:predicted kinase
MTDPISEARHRVIAREIRNDIEAGRLRPGQRLPSTRALAAQWNVSVGAINDAMQLLEADGLIVSRARSGRVVSESATTTYEQLRPGRPRVVFVGGYAGSGKTEFGRVLARESGWAVLDKDTITRTVVDTALVQLGSTIADRESPTYLEIVRPAEYRCLEAAVEENLGCGVSVICSAPFLREFNNPAWFERTAATVAGLGADMSVIWMRCSIPSMRSYIERRGAARDTWKLANWEEYTKNVNEKYSPPWPHTIISNNPDDEPIQAQAKAFLRSVP